MAQRSQFEVSVEFFHQELHRPILARETQGHCRDIAAGKTEKRGRPASFHWFRPEIRSYCPHHQNRDGTQDWMAERVGFEPTVEFPLHTLSKRAP
jgi:hypothetical protein